ncbi:hypothetical protein C1646_816404 [Rhizophagus diaphanus]|nr:hypothetical protein C1646_816404 [Rhizophagus diaphanus] [Rhizophagus sp. MUCL 43196]
MSLSRDFHSNIRSSISINDILQRQRNLRRQRQVRNLISNNPNNPNNNNQNNNQNNNNQNNHQNNHQNNNQNIQFFQHQQYAQQLFNGKGIKKGERQIIGN